MRRWVWRVLLAALVLAALTGSAMAADPVTAALENGVVLTENGSNWKVTGYTGTGGQITIPSKYQSKAVTVIAEKAFTATAITEVIIPASITEVEVSAFEKCPDLQTVVFLERSSSAAKLAIKERAFLDCERLTNIIFSEGLESIGARAFSGADGLTSLVIPDNVNSIGELAFAHCTKLKTIYVPTSLKPPAGTATKPISATTFSDTTLESIHYGGTTPSNPKSDIYSIFAALPPGLTGASIHYAVCDRVISEPTCQKTGRVLGGATCSEVGNIHTDVCDSLKDIAPPITLPMLAHDWADDGNSTITKQPTCKEEGEKSTPQKCTMCGETRTKTEPIDKLETHSYGGNSETVEHPLFEGYCGDGTEGLILVTRKCSVCNDYTPVCWKCQKLEWELAKANAELETAQKAYDEATANVAAAEKALEDANAAKAAADAAVTEAGKNVKDAADAADEAKKKFDALGDDATEEERAAAEKALDDANEALLDAKMAEVAANKAAAAAAAAVTKAGDEKAAADKALTTPIDLENALKAAQSNVSDKKAELTAHVESTAPKSHQECPECNEKRNAIDAATGSAKKKAEEAYETHYNTAHPDTLTDITSAILTKGSGAVGHVWGKDYEEVITQAVCGSTDLGETKIWHDCTVCETHELVETITTRPAKKHTPDPSAEAKIKKAATCTEEGIRGYEPDVKCATCGHEIGEGFTEPIPALKHDLVYDKDIIVEATCTTPGSKTEVWVCSRGDKCSAVLEGGKEPYSEKKEPVITPAKGHTWGDFTPDEGQDMTPNETCAEKKVTGKVKCAVCGAEEAHTLTIEGLGKHTWGEWEDGEDGKQVRECSVCGKTEERDDPNKPTEPDEPDEPDEPEDPDDPGKPTEPETPKDYQVNIIQGSNGTTTANRTTAKSGDQVTITVSPASGYELDMLRVISADGKVLNLTSLGGGQYRFTMSAANAEVRATFSKKSGGSWSGSNWASAPGEGSSSTDPRRTTDVMPTQNPTQSVPKAGAYEQLFRDIPTNHWAAGEINWANQMGYMNGTAGRFNPDGIITHQQMWMVLARLTGSHPANMTEARRWAVEHSFADGSSPTGAVARHQLVTALYRCAHLMGSANRNTTSLAGYPDSRTVPTVARDAYSWALANGIVSGTANGRLDPNGTLTRAQFAVILYRYSQRV